MGVLFWGIFLTSRPHDHNLAHMEKFFLSTRFFLILFQVFIKGIIAPTLPRRLPVFQGDTIQGINAARADREEATGASQATDPNRNGYIFFTPVC